MLLLLVRRFLSDRGKVLVTKVSRSFFFSLFRKVLNVCASLSSSNIFRSGAREKEALPDRPDESSEVGSLERAQKARREPTLRSRSQAQSPGLLARPVSIDVVGVENGYDEVNIQISAKYKYEYLSAINCVWSEECRDICSRDKTLSKSHLDQTQSVPR